MTVKHIGKANRIIESGYAVSREMRAVRSAAMAYSLGWTHVNRKSEFNRARKALAEAKQTVAALEIQLDEIEKLIEADNEQ